MLVAVQLVCISGVADDTAMKATKAMTQMKERREVKVMRKLQHNVKGQRSGYIINVSTGKRSGRRLLKAEREAKEREKKDAQLVMVAQQELKEMQAEEELAEVTEAKEADYQLRICGHR